MADELKIRVKQVIRERCDGITRQFSDRTGIAVSTINSWNDENIPSGRHLDAIRRAFGVNLHWLVAGVGYPYIDDAAGAGAAGDKNGIYGITRQEIAGGTLHTTTEYATPSEPAQAISRAVQMLSSIFVAGDEVLTRAIMANLIAFSRAARRDKAQADQIRNLEAECADLKGRLEAVEKRLGTPTPQPAEKVGASSRKSGAT